MKKTHETIKPSEKPHKSKHYPIFQLFVSVSKAINTFNCTKGQYFLVSPFKKQHSPGMSEIIKS